MAHIIDIEERRQLWHDVLAERRDLRRVRIASLGVTVLSEVGGAVDLHHNHDHVFERTFLLLDAHELVAGLLEPYASLEAEDDAARLLPEDFIAIVTSRVARIARGESADAAEAAELFRFWRRGLYDRVERDPDSLTVAETAALYGISVQAVYKWIRTGRVQSFKGDDNKQRIKADDLRTTRDEERSIDEVRQALRDNLAGRRVRTTPELLDSLAAPE